jgi:hypothetical protein
MRDTTPAADQARLDAIRRMEPVQRLVRTLELSEWVRAVALARLRTAHPDYRDLELVELLLGRPLVPDRPARLDR